MSLQLQAQKNDYVWLSGYRSDIGYDSASHVLYGTSVLDFNYSPRQIDYDSIAMNFDRTNTSYCDNNGALLFYSNGIYVANKLDEKIENGDSLNAGFFQYVWDPIISYYGYRTGQGIIALPNPANETQYFILHSYMDTFWTGQLYAHKLYLTVLDMQENAGHGKVVSKNQSLIEDTLGWEVNAMRHANGRDWWMLVQQRNTNCYYRVLVDESGPHALPGYTCTGNVISYGRVASTCFSPDGSKFIYLSIYGGVNIYDFDRCSGTLSNTLYVPIPVFGDSTWIGNGVSISPNNRFLYVGATGYVFQYDLWAADIAGSIDTVAIYDGYRAPFNTLFHTMQLGPDGKIYESCGNSARVYHVIERPNEKGDSCLFMQHSIHLPTSSLGVPNFPNYRLGALPGSPCDTLTGLNEIERAEKERLLRVFPNPATDFVTIDYGFTDWSKGEVNLEIANELGQIVYSQNPPMYSGFQKIDVSQFSTGIYTAHIRRGNQVVGSVKFGKN